MKFKQSVFGRLFNYGNVCIKGNLGSSELVFEFV